MQNKFYPAIKSSKEDNCVIIETNKLDIDSIWLNEGDRHYNKTYPDMWCSQAHFRIQEQIGVSEQNDAVQS